MAHVAKYTKGALGHMLKHYERAKDEFGEYIKFGNQNIDTNKTELNYNLAPKREKMTQGEFIKNRCSEVKCLNRKNVNVMCTWVVTAPKDLPKEKEREFFKSTYDFLSNRYGKNNVVSAYVHNDEITPHMHFAFVPVVFDKTKNIEKVSAKERVDKKDLLTFHKNLDQHLESTLGLKLNILNEATKQGNKSIEELKRGTAIKELSNLENKKNALEERLNSLEDIKEHLDNIDNIQAKKSLLGGSMSIKKEDYEELLHLAKKSIIYQKKNKELLTENENLQGQKEYLRKELNQYTGIDAMIERSNERKAVVKIKKENNIMESYIKNKGLESEFNEFSRHINMNIRRNKNFDMER